MKPSRARLTQTMADELRPGTTKNIVATGPDCVRWRVPRGSP